MRTKTRNINANKSFQLKTLYEHVEELLNASNTGTNNGINELDIFLHYHSDFLFKLFVLKENDTKKETCISTLTPPPGLENAFIGQVVVYQESLPIDLNIHLEIINYVIAVLKSMQYGTNILISSPSFIINNTEWFILHQVLGSWNFIDLLLNYKIFEYMEENLFTQLSGNRNLINNHNSIYVNPYKKVVTEDGPIGMKIFSPQYYLFKLQNAALQVSITNDTENTLIEDKTKELKKMYYNLIPNESILQSMNIIFGNNFNENSPLYLSFKPVWSLVKKNHKKLAYWNILNTVCPLLKNKEPPTTINSAIDVGKVIKFLLIIVEKLFPLELWGEKHNKAIVFHNLNKLLKMDINKSIPMHLLLQEISFNKMTWIGQTSSKDNPNFRKEGERFFEWFYLKFFPKIVKTFFYVTNISSKITQIVYYRQDVYMKIVYPFISKYCDDNLQKNKTCVLLPNDIQTKNQNQNKIMHDLSCLHTTLRIVPKNLKLPNDLRFISIPSPHIQFKDLMKFKWFVQDHIIPVRKILQHIRLHYLSVSDSFPKLSNLYEIPILIKNFKNLLKVKDSVYFLKFDVKSCYDSIPIDLFITLLQEKWLKDEKLLNKTNNGQWIVYKNSVSLLNTNLAFKQVVRKEYIINGVNALHNCTRPNNSTIQGQNTVKEKDRNGISDFIKINQRNTDIQSFTNEDILYVVKKELLQTCVTIGDACFQRKIGVFQGTFLSSIIMDLLYDDMLRSTAEFHSPSKQCKLLVLRLADDFLVLSNSYEKIQQIMERSTRGFPEYNAYINSEKLEFSHCKDVSKNPANVNFVGLTVDIPSLEMSKDSETFTNIKYSFEPSLKAVYGKLLNLIEIRLKYNLLNIQLNSNQIIIRHLTLIVSNLVQSWIEFVVLRRTKLRLFDNLQTKTGMQNFAKFIKNLVKSLHYHLWKINSYIFDQKNSKLAKRKQFKKLKSLSFRYNALEKNLSAIVTQTIIAKLHENQKTKTNLGKLIDFVQQMRQ
ncbi:hypothetical protein ACO0RG_003958 [Hanseniaspora osmophila]